MNVPSFEFLIFAAVGALAFRVAPSAFWRLLVLAGINGVFFLSQSHGLVSIVPYAAFVVVSYGFVAGLQAFPDQRRTLAPVFVLLTLLGFVWLKKYGFFPSFVLIRDVYVVIGLSYVFFRVLQLVIDVGAGVVDARVGPLTYFNYAMNFTTLVSGPIQRFQDYSRQQSAPEGVTLPVFGHSLERIAKGMFKVFVLSALLRQLQTHELAHMSEVQSPLAHIVCGALIAVSYPLFLYCNFSGYTDVVIGCARWFGMALPENFRNPFWSDNFINFWGRWHITLSNWLKTYVYNTLLMRLMSRFPARSAEPYFAVLAFFVTFFLVGVWHGQTSEFVAFGALQGGGVAANKLYQIFAVRWLGKSGYKSLCANRLYKGLTRGMTFAWFAFTLFWFWGSWRDLEQLWTTFGPAEIAIIFALVMVASAAVIELVREAYEAGGRFQIGGVVVLQSKYVRTVQVSLLLMATVCMILLSNSPAPDIVYKTF